MTRLFALPARRFAAGLAALFLALVIAGCSQQADEPISEGPAIWEVEGAEGTVYLFGTFHLLPNDLEWRNETINGALEATTVNVFELNALEIDQASAGQLMQQKGMQPGGYDYKGKLSEEEYAKLEEILSGFGLPMQAAQSMKPWLLSLTLSQLVMQKMGLNPQAGVDMTLMTEAQQAGESIEQLETLEEQINALSGVSEDVQLNMLRQSINEFERSEEMLTEMKSLWATGDVDGMDRVVLGQMREYDEVYQALIVKRNANWIPPIEQYIKSGDTVFIAVGAGHLVGEDSVIKMLEDKGYTVKRR